VVELVGGDLLEGAAGQFLLDGPELGDAAEEFFFGHKDFLEGFEFLGAWGVML